MDPLPLIPKSKIQENHDTSHVLREAFQDVLDGKIFPKNIADNATKNFLDNKALKANAASVERAQENITITLDDITEVETEIMISQGKYIIVEDKVNNDCRLEQWLRLRRHEIFDDLNKDRVKKYGLLQKIDILPSRPERALDFRINSNQHLCQPPCPSDLDLLPTKLDKKLTKKGTTGTKGPKGTAKLQNIDELIFTPVFQAYPERVVFDNYIVNRTYEKKFTIKNISKSTRGLMPRFLPKSSCFTVELASQSTRVAPGMNIIFRVIFRPVSYLDVQEIISFNTGTEVGVSVKLISYRNAPNLHVYVFKTFDNFVSKFESNKNRFFDEERSSALNSTIDCGSVLLGDEVNLSLIIKNEGSTGLFFILSEEEWYFSDIKAISQCMELTSGAFQIWPIYFEVNKDEFVEISIKFCPLSSGLQAEKCLLLCNNISNEEIDLVGDGVLFEEYFIKIDAPRKLGNTSYMDSESEYCLYLGNCLSYSQQMSIITVHNNSCLNLKYRWEVDKSVCYLETTKLKRMDESWLQIKHLSHCFPPYSTTDFEIVISMNTFEEGQYSIVLSLYIEDVPEASLAEDTNFLVVETRKKSNESLAKPTYLDVVIGGVEISCVIESVHLIIEPPQMLFPIVLNYQDSVKKKLQLMTNGKFNLHCKWKIVNKKNSKTCCVKISPTKFILRPEKPYICEVTVVPHDYEDIHEKLTLEINDGIYKKEYNVMAKVQKPMLRFSCSAIHFGYLPKGTNATQTFFVESMSEEKIQWRIIEFTYDFEQREIVEIQNEKQLSINSGMFDCYGAKCKVEYCVDAKDNHRWFSFLMLLSSHPMQIAMDSICLVTYEVCQPYIKLSSPTCESPVLCPRELLFLGITTSYNVYLHNIGNINGYFLWGKPVGSDAKSLDICIKPRTGILHSDESAEIKFLLTPQQTGIFEHIYVPCFVGRMDEPLMLTILCAADNIHVNFFLPQKSGLFLKILWPEKIIDDYEFMHEIEQSAEDFKFEHRNDSDSFFQRRLRELQQNYVSEVDETATPSPLGTLNSVVTIFENKECESEQYKGMNSSISGSDTNWTSTSTLPEKLDCSISLTKCFKSDLILQQHFIEILYVPIHTLTKRTIIIQNVTPIRGCFNIEAINFGVDDLKERNIVDDTLVRLKIKQRNDWENMIKSDLGIVVKPEPISGEIMGFESTEVNLWLYSNTWGIYVEEVLVEINDVLPFCFTVLIQVIGNPIEFPIGLNTIQEEPILRFGHVQYLSEAITRSLKVRNICAIPISIRWQITVSKIADNYCPEISVDPKSCTSSIENVDQNCRIPDCSDTLNEEMFKVHPKKTYIEPKAVSTLSITFYPKYFCPHFPKDEVEAFIIAHIHIKEEHQYQANYLNRLEGTLMPPPKVKMLATMEVPLLKLDLVGGATKLKTFANDIVSSGTKTFTMRLIFRNLDHSDSIVSMHVNEPFKLLSLKTLECDEHSSAKAAIVKPNKCLETNIKCTLTCKQVQDMSDMLYHNHKEQNHEIVDLDYYSITLLQNLNIHQKGVKQQFLPLQITIFYPQIQTRQKVVDFGVIFIGNTKKIQLPIYNLTGTRVCFKIDAPIVSEFVVKPLEGEIEKTTSPVEQRFDLNIYFTPSCSKNYADHLSIMTNTSSYSIDIILTGIGSYNEKFYSDIL